METSYSAFGASSQLAKNQLNSQQRFACCCRFTRLIDHGHGTRASPWRPLTREENFYIAFPTSLDCLSPPFPPHVGGDGRTRTARGRCLDFVTRLGKQRRRPLPCTALPLSLCALWRSRQSGELLLTSNAVATSFCSPQVGGQDLTLLRCVNPVCNIPPVKWEIVTKVEEGASVYLAFCLRF